MSHAQRGPLASFAALAMVSATLVGSHMASADDNRIVVSDDGEILVQPQGAAETLPRTAVPREIADGMVRAEDSAAAFGGAGDPAAGLRGDRPQTPAGPDTDDGSDDVAEPQRRGDSGDAEQQAGRDRGAEERERSGAGAHPGVVRDTGSDDLPEVDTGSGRDDERGQQQGPQEPGGPDKDTGDRGTAKAPIQKLGSGIWLFLPPMIDGSEDAPAGDDEESREQVDGAGRDGADRDSSEAGDRDRAPATAPSAGESTSKGEGSGPAAPAAESGKPASSGKSKSGSAKSGKAKSGKAKTSRSGAPGKHRATGPRSAGPQGDRGRGHRGTAPQRGPSKNRGWSHRGKGSQHGKARHPGKRWR